MKPKVPLKIDLDSESKKVYYGDDGSVVDKPKEKKIKKKIENSEIAEVNEVPKVKNKIKFKKNKDKDESGKIEEKWYMKFADYNTSELKEIKDSEINALTQLCRTAFNEIVTKLEKSKSFLFLQFHDNDSNLFFQIIHLIQSGYKLHYTKEHQKIVQMLGLFSFNQIHCQILQHLKLW